MADNALYVRLTQEDNNQTRCSVQAGYGTPALFWLQWNRALSYQEQQEMNAAIHAGMSRLLRART